MRNSAYLYECGKYGNKKIMFSGNKCEQRLYFIIFWKLLSVYWHCKHKAKMSAVNLKYVHMLICLANNVYWKQKYQIDANYFKHTLNLGGFVLPPPPPLIKMLFSWCGHESVMLYIKCKCKSNIKRITWTHTLETHKKYFCFTKTTTRSINRTYCHRNLANKCKLFSAKLFSPM